MFVILFDLYVLASGNSVTCVLFFCSNYNYIRGTENSSGKRATVEGFPFNIYSYPWKLGGGVGCI